MSIKVYGPHLTMDLLGCDPAKVSSGAFIYQFMSDLPGKIGMAKIGQPHLDLYSGPFKEWGGFSASIHIQTSHITFHFFDWGYAFGDIFSCKPFDYEATFELIKKELGADSNEPKFIDPTADYAIQALEFIKDKKSEYGFHERGFNFPPSLM